MSRLNEVDFHYEGDLTQLKFVLQGFAKSSRVKRQLEQLSFKDLTWLHSLKQRIHNLQVSFWTSYVHE